MLAAHGLAQAPRRRPARRPGPATPKKSKTTSGRRRFSRWRTSASASRIPAARSWRLAVPSARSPGSGQARSLFGVLGELQVRDRRLRDGQAVGARHGSTDRREARQGGGRRRRDVGVTHPKLQGAGWRAGAERHQGPAASGGSIVYQTADARQDVRQSDRQHRPEPRELARRSGVEHHPRRSLARLHHDEGLYHQLQYFEVRCGTACRRSTRGV